jgi:hypothetical protein
MRAGPNSLRVVRELWLASTDLAVVLLILLLGFGQIGFRVRHELLLGSLITEAIGLAFVRQRSPSSQP